MFRDYYIIKNGAAVTMMAEAALRAAIISNNLLKTAEIYRITDTEQFKVKTSIDTFIEPVR